MRPADRLRQLRQFAFRGLPVADIPIPAAQRFRRNPFVLVQAPSVVDDEGAAAELPGKVGVFIKIVGRERRVDRVPGAVDRLPRLIRVDRGNGKQQPSEGRYRLRQRPPAFIQPQLEGFGRRIDGKRKRQFIAAGLLIHLRLYPAIVEAIGQTDRKTVAVILTVECPERETPVGSAGEFHRPRQFQRRQPFHVRMPASSGVDERCKAFDRQDIACPAEKFAVHCLPGRERSEFDARAAPKVKVRC
ncbi:hypothetical protein SDC9_158214 [bioreactor metagenome]|uniref:Uncharacterized protein n=1 Tax=bioreactor metagenome TaxID=1076179 RepID=A0A645F9J7_9ZZZZ